MEREWKKCVNKLNYNKYTKNTLKHLVHIDKLGVKFSEAAVASWYILYIENVFSSQKYDNDGFTLLIGKFENAIAWLIAK